MHLHVTCALIEREGRVLCTRRSASMSLPLKWEFPGRKITLNEHDRAAWVLQDDLADIDWAGADVGVMKNYLAHAACPRKHGGESRGTLLAEEDP